jgi:hypothetical protein
MARKPAGDLGSMAISKAAAADAKPFAAREPTIGAGGVKSLTVKLDASTYAALREYCYAQERATGHRATHQQVVVEMIKTALVGRK